MKNPDPKLVEEFKEKMREYNHPDPNKYCLKSRPQHKGMLGGPKYLCMMHKGHEGTCFKEQQWSPYC